VEGIDDLNVLDVWDNVLSIAETFYIIPEALIMLLLDGLQCFSHTRILIHALKVIDECGT
jgi:hypothetical protein